MENQEVTAENLFGFKDGSSGQETQIPKHATVQIFDVSQSSVVGSCWPYGCSLG